MTQSAIILVAGFATLLVILFGDDLKKRKQAVRQEGLANGLRGRTRSGQSTV